MMKTFDRTEIIDILTELEMPRQGAVSVLNHWLERGDGVAVYQNVDLGNQEIGHRQFVSFGSEEALLPGEPPERMPDVGGAINWRYILEGIYRGEAL